MRLIVLLCLLTPYSLMANGAVQYPQLRPWEQKLEEASTATDSLYPMLKLARHYIYIDRSKTLAHLNWASEQDIPNESLAQAEWYAVQGVLQRQDFNRAGAIQFLEKALALYERNDQIVEAAHTRYLLLMPYLDLERDEEAKAHFHKADSMLRQAGHQDRKWYYVLRYFRNFQTVTEYRNTRHAIENLLPKLKQLDDPGLVANAYKHYSTYYQHKKKFSKSLSLLDSTLYYLRQATSKSVVNRDRSFCHAYNLRGWNYRYKSEYDSAIYAFRAGLQHGKSGGSSSDYSLCVKGLANIYEIQQDYDQAYPLLKEALELDRKRRDRQEVAWIYNALGNVFEGMGNRSEALNYYRESVRINDSIGHFAYPIFKMDLAGIYLKFGKADSAIQTLLRGKSISSFFDTAYGEEIIYLARIYRKAGQFEKAYRCYKHVLQREQGWESLRMEVNALQGLGKIYLQQPGLITDSRLQEMDIDNVEGLFQLAFEKAQTSGLLELMAEGARLLSDFYQQNGQYQLALRYQDQYVKLNDSLVNLRSEQALESLQAKHEVNEKENRIALLEKNQELKEMELKQAEEARKKNLYFWVGSVLILLIAGGGLFARYRYIEREKRRRIREREAIKIEAQKKLEQSKSQFFANMTHEFKTPIALLQSPLQKLLEEESNTTKREYLKIMQRNSDRMLQLTNQLLDINKLENRSLELHPHYGDLVGFLTRLTKDFQIFAEQKGLRFELDLPSHPVEAVFDSERLEIVFFNLLSNAIKFTEKGGHVGVRMEMVNDNKLQVAITDTGIGIPAESQPQVFDRFYQGDQQRDGSGGTGLGLAISRELVQLHRGAIAVQSQPGEGSTFTVTLPLFALEVDSLKVDKEQTATTSKIQSPAKRKHRILVIDDNDDLRKVLKHLLSPGYKVLTAKDGKEGLDRALKEIPNLIISDIMMPQLDGMEMLSTIRNDERTSHIPFIFLTAKGRMQQKLKGLETGADDYLAKPFNNEEVLLKVQNLLQRVDQLRERFRQISVNPDTPTSKLTREEQFIQKVVDIIQRNLADTAFSVDALSEQLHMSRSQLYRKLQAITGKGPKTFIREVRLNNAHELLKQGDQTVSEVCYKVGFSNPSYFSAAFKEVFGISPLEAAQT